MPKLTTLRDMAGRSPILRYFVATDALLERVDPQWWGAVVTDSRFPNIYDLNYARVEGAHSDLTLEEISTALLPALQANGSPHFHAVMFEPDDTPALLGEMEARGDEMHFDT